MESSICQPHSEKLKRRKSPWKNNLTITNTELNPDAIQISCVHDLNGEYLCPLLFPIQKPVNSEINADTMYEVLLKSDQNCLISGVSLKKILKCEKLASIRPSQTKMRVLNCTFATETGRSLYPGKI